MTQLIYALKTCVVMRCGIGLTTEWILCIHSTITPWITSELLRVELLSNLCDLVVMSPVEKLQLVTSNLREICITDKLQNLSLVLLVLSGLVSK